MVSNPDSYIVRDIEEMKTKLHHENWEDNSLLPEGWKLKKAEEKLKENEVANDT